MHLRKISQPPEVFLLFLEETPDNQIRMTRQESEAWLKNYADPIESERRKRKLSRRLERFDWSALPSHPRWVDLCCGHGEALDLLIDKGIKRPSGIDLTTDPKLAQRIDIDWRCGDATRTPFASHTYDVVSHFHALHHLGGPSQVAALMNEVDRLLKPGGQLWVIDFSNSWSIRLAFLVFRIRFFGFERWWFGSRYLQSFSKTVREEWPFLREYLPQWPAVRKALFDDPRFEQIDLKRSIFYFYLQLRKRTS